MTGKQKVGIIGLGYVGGAVHHWFKNFCSDRIEVFTYDKYKNNGSLAQVNEAEIFFVCVPTPYYEDGRGVAETASHLLPSSAMPHSGYDDSEVQDALSRIKNSKTVVIKSTVLPGSTESFQKQFPQHKILFNPEFLTAKNALQDFLKPDRQIIGYTEKSRLLAEKVLELLPKAPFSRIMKSTEAEMIKYFNNIFLATKVVFANQIYDLCKKLEIDYNAVKESAGADSRINPSHLDIFQDGYRGYSGVCLPKDTKALIDFAQKLGVDLDLIKKVDEINSKLLKKRLK